MLRSSFRLVLAFLLFAGCLLAGATFMRLGLQKDVYHYVCSMVHERFFAPGPELDRWAKQCHEKASSIPFFLTLNELFDRIRVQLDELGVSHVSVYNPVDDKRLWKGEATDTGIRTYMIDGYTVISKIFPGSAADQLDLKKGDIIEAINERPVQSRWQVQTEAGRYLIRRGEKRFSVDMKPTPLKIDEYPVIYNLGDKNGLLKISSFRGDYFPKEAWRNLAGQLTNFKHVIVDVRDNAGGSFIAMLRALSPFFCDPTTVGKLVQPQKGSGHSNQIFVDNITEEMQLEALERAKDIVLKTYSDYGCYKGKVTVLVNGQTASVSEIFAEAFRDEEWARVWGSQTAGDVVLAVWYEIPHLGEGYSLSIPEAIFYSRQGESLESQGVWPERKLFYLIEDALEGRDTWLKEATQDSKSFSKPRN